MENSKLQQIAKEHVERVANYAHREEVRGNEQGTKQSLIGPLLSALGWDLSDPMQCVAEHKPKLGSQRSKYPLDWALRIDGKTAILVEAKAAGRALAGHSQQLQGYWTDAKEARFAILTNGEQWQFYTDDVLPNQMDDDPFAVWDASAPGQDAIELLKLIQRVGFEASRVQSYAEGKRREQRTLLALSNALKRPADNGPCDELLKVVIKEAYKPSRDGKQLGNITAQILDEWRKPVERALGVWAAETAVSVLRARASVAPGAVDEEVSKVVTTEAELQAFELIVATLGPEYPVAYQDGVAYFKVHVSGKPTHTIARIFADRSKPSVHFPLEEDVVRAHSGDRELSKIAGGWTAVKLASIAELTELRALLVAAYDVN